VKTGIRTRKSKVSSNKAATKIEIRNNKKTIEMNRNKDPAVRQNQ
jgi:hypothetical protein